MFLQLDRNTELAQAVDVNLQFDSQSQEAVFVFFVTVFSKRNRKHVFLCFYQVIQTFVKVWENSKKLWKHLPFSFSQTSTRVSITR